MSMEKVFEILNYFGLNVSVESKPIVLLLCGLFVLSLFAALSILNIGIYLLALYITNQKWFLD